MLTETPTKISERVIQSFVYLFRSDSICRMVRLEDGDFWVKQRCVKFRFIGACGSKN